MEGAGGELRDGGYGGIVGVYDLETWDKGGKVGGRGLRLMGRAKKSALGSDDLFWRSTLYIYKFIELL